MFPHLSNGPIDQNEEDLQKKNSSSACRRSIFFFNPSSFRLFGQFDKWGILKKDMRKKI